MSIQLSSKKNSLANFFSSYYHLNINAMSLNKMTFELIAFCYCCSASLIESHLAWSRYECVCVSLSQWEREVWLINVNWQACSYFWFIIFIFFLLFFFFQRFRCHSETDRQIDSRFTQSIGKEARERASIRYRT